MASGFHLSTAPRPFDRADVRRARSLSLEPPLVWLWPASLVLAQLTLARNPGFDLTVAVVACHAIQLYLIAFAGFRRPSRGQLLVLLIILLQVLIVGAGSADPDQFARSLAHLLNLALMLLICANLKVRDWRSVRRSIAVFCVGGMVVSGLVAVQFVAFNLYDDLSYARLLGPFSPTRAPGLAEVYVPRGEPLLRRPNGPFSEPSIAGWFLIFTAAVALSSRSVHPRLAAATALASGLGALLTLSLTGILGMGALMLAWLLMAPGERRFKMVVVGILGASALAACFSAIGPALLERAGELDRPGTSIHGRFVAPLEAIARSLGEAPLGAPIGQLAPAVVGSDLAAWFGGLDASMDNMLFTIVLHFGLLGVVMNLAYLLGMLRLLVLRRHVVGLLMLAVLIMLATTGAGWAHQSVLMIGYAILVGRYLLARERKARPRTEDRPAPTPPPRPARPPAETPAAAPPRVAWRRPGAPP